MNFNENVLPWIIFFGIVVLFQYWLLKSRLSTRQNEWNIFFVLLMGLGVGIAGSALLSNVPSLRMLVYFSNAYGRLFNGMSLNLNLLRQNLEVYFLGIAGFLVIHFVLFAFPYLLSVRIPSMRPRNFWGRCISFNLLYFGSLNLIRLLATQSDLLNPYNYPNLGFYGLALRNQVNPAYAALALTAISLAYDLFKYFDEKKPRFSWTTLAVIGGYWYWIYHQIGNHWMAFAGAGLAWTWFGARWTTWLLKDHKLQRLLYWVVSDLGGVLILVGSWLYWHNGWLSLLLFIGSSILYAVLVYSLSFQLFPVVARQAWIENYRNAGQKDQAERLEVELRRVEAEAVRKRTLRQFRRHQNWFIKAEVARRGRQPDRALQLLAQVITPLEKISSLSNEQKLLLGSAYQARAKVRLAQGKIAETEADLKRAKAYISPDLELMGGLVEYMADHNVRTNTAFEYYRQYLKMRQGQAVDNRSRKVIAQLEVFCQIQKDTSVNQAAAMQETARLVIATDSRVAWAHRVCGQAAILLGNWDEALVELETAHSIDANDKTTHIALGEVYHHFGRLNDTRRSFEEALRLDANLPAVAYQLGMLLLDEYPRPSPEDLKVSVQWLEHAASKEPRNVQYHYDLARAQARVGNGKAARATLLKTLKLNAEFIPAHRMLADLLFDLADYAEALPHYRKAATVKPVDPAVQVRLGTCLAETKEFAEATVLLSPLVQELPEGLLPLGRAHLGLGEYKKAADLLRRYLDKKPDSAPACYYLGCALAWLGSTVDPANYQEARAWFDKASKLDSSLAPKTYLQIGHLLLRGHSIPEAIRYYETAVRSPEVALEATVAMARALLASDRADAAQKAIDKLNQEQREQGQVQYVLGLAAELQDNFDLAERAYRVAKAFGLLGVILYRKGKAKEALEMLQKAREAGENSDRILYYSGLAKIDCNDLAGAKADWELLAKRYPDDRRLASNITRLWYLIGCGYYRNAEFVQAAQAWENFYQAYASDDLTRQGLAQMYLLAAYFGKTKAETGRFLTRAKELGADSYLCDSLVVHKLLQEHDLAAGIQGMKRLEAQNGADPVLLYNYGLACLLNGDLDGAVKRLDQARKNSAGDLQTQSTWALAASLAEQQEWSQAAGLLADLGY